MKNFIVYDRQRKILRTGLCQDIDFDIQVHDGEFGMKGIANGATQKVEFDGFDDNGQPINPRVVNKTPAEVEVDNSTPPKIPKSKKLVGITNEQWQDVLDRLEKLEKN